MAARGARLLLLCRSEEKGRQAAAEITADTGGQVELIRCDLADRASIASAAAAVAERLDGLDILVNNAGAYFPRHSRTPDGLEMSFAVNHLGPMLLTLLLLPLLRAGAPSRVVTVSSRAHRRGRLDLNDLQRERQGYLGLPAYADSKLCNVLMSNHLATLLAGTGVTSNSLHPGVIRTGFAQDEPGLLNWLTRLGAPLLLSPEDGARTTLHVATDPSLAEVSGQYFASSRRKRPSRQARDPELARVLWERSCALLGRSPALDQTT